MPSASRGVRAQRLLIAIIALAAAFAFTRYWDFALPAFGARYQAVFLANGQTYFGHYLDRLGPYVKVENAFYIATQPTAEEGQTPESRLIRRGSELHQPLPYVLIPKSAILFVEDLRSDSQVAQFMDRELAK
ncbi:MAG TPA: hypothetical protein VGK15_04835 [Candidatus Limnocylindria bacterium]|jgi:hypothetical protein